MRICNSRSGCLVILLLHQSPHPGNGKVDSYLFSNASGSTTFTDKYEKVSTSGFLAFKNIKITDTLDYLIELPATNKQYYVSAATIQPLVDTVWCNEHRGGYGYCYSWSQYFIVNGDTVQPYRYGNFELVLLLNK